VTVKDRDLGGHLCVGEGAELVLQRCTVRETSGRTAVAVFCAAVVQDCIIQDCPEAYGIQVDGVATITSTTTRRCMYGIDVTGKATIVSGCSITDCTRSGIVAFKDEEGPGEANVAGADLVCKGHNAANDELEGNFVCMQGGTIKGIAEENIVTC